MMPTPLLSALLLLAAAGACIAEDVIPPTPFLSCPTPKDPIEVRVKGCTGAVCKVPKGQIAGMEVDFEVDQDVARLDAVVTAYALGAVLEFPLKQKNACKSLTNAECPLDKYEVVTYKLELPVESTYPSISLVVDIGLRDKNQRYMMCYRLNLAVVDPE
ncbi:NPC intracellular cholesterol transporter 2-like [Thrips palmi]|uniref:NPC intracellular cholesterol transporter 2-like n=1 Tax=Thrips palmi TaxID=161013 RepID=A0A6P8YN77_THRPL|nr:NPC intracellular cholesterol transporter 2-like [Thrips palmi]